MSKHDNTLPTKTSFFISSARKIESLQEFKINLLRVAVSLQMTAI